MTDFFRRDDGWKLWKLAIWKLTVNCITAGLGVGIAATASVKFSSLSAEEITTIVVGMFLAMSKVVDSFIDQTVSNIRAKQAQPPALIHP